MSSRSSSSSSEAELDDIRRSRSSEMEDSSSSSSVGEGAGAITPGDANNPVIPSQPHSSGDDSSSSDDDDDNGHVGSKSRSATKNKKKKENPGVKPLPPGAPKLSGGSQFKALFMRSLSAKRAAKWGTCCQVCTPCGGVLLLGLITLLLQSLIEPQAGVVETQNITLSQDAAFFQDQDRWLEPENYPNGTATGNFTYNYPNGTSGDWPASQFTGDIQGTNGQQWFYVVDNTAGGAAGRLNSDATFSGMLGGNFDFMRNLTESLQQASSQVFNQPWPQSPQNNYFFVRPPSKGQVDDGSKALGGKVPFRYDFWTNGAGSSEDDVDYVLVEAEKVLYDQVADVDTKEEDGGDGAVASEFDIQRMWLPNGALLFDAGPSGAVRYTVQFLDTTEAQRTNAWRYLTDIVRTPEPVDKEVRAGSSVFETLVNFMSNALLIEATGNEQARITTSQQQFPYYDDGTTAIKAIAGGIASFILPFVLTPLLASFIYLVVLEKETKLRELMKQMGMNDNQYWSVTWLFNFAMWIVVMILFFIMGLIFSSFLPFFLTPGLPIIALLSWGICMIGIAFMATVFIGQNRVITTLIIYSLLVISAVAGFTINLLGGVDQTFPWGWLMLYPPFAFYRTLDMQFRSCISGSGCMTLDVFFGTTAWEGGAYDLAEAGRTALFYLWIETLVIYVLWVYLKEVVPQNFGIPRPWNFPYLMARDAIRKRASSKGKGKVGDPESGQGAGTEGDTIPVRPDGTQITKDMEDEDIREERLKVYRGDYDGFPCVVRSLSKQYSGSKVLSANHVSFAIQPGECFGLLGPNGSGKTTTISMLTGLFPSTGGAAEIFGINVGDDPEQAHMHIGVCPQFDVHWPQLTVYDHLMFFARLRGLGTEKHVKNMATRVGLDADLNTRSEDLSGGMRRRLSVAMAIVGQPPVVVLDEPTTGLDVASRRAVWSVLDEYRRDHNASILLTTHSMEEADTLCSRIMIIALGRCRTLGSPTRLKAKFGGGFSFSASFVAGKAEKGVQAVESTLRKRISDDVMDHVNVELLDVPGEEDTYRFAVSDEAGVKISNIMEVMQDYSVATSAKKGLIADWALEQTSLETVFLRVSEQVAAEEAELNEADDNSDDSNSDSEEAAKIEAAREIKGKRSSFGTQLKALLRKNLQLTLRNKIYLSLLAPFLVMFLLFIIDVAVSSAQAPDTIDSPKTYDMSPILSCEKADGYADDCFTIGYCSDDASANTAQITAVINDMAKGSCTDDEDCSTKLFDNYAAMEDFRIGNDRTLLFGVKFTEFDPSLDKYSYTLYYDRNITATSEKKPNNPAVDEILYVQASSNLWPLQVQLDRALLKFSSAGANAITDLVVKQKDFPLATFQITLAGFIAAANGSLFLFFPSAILAFIVLYQLAMDKELNLRLGMETVGLRPSVYWMSWLVTTQIYNVSVVLVTMISGAIFQLPLMMSGKVDLFITFITFYLFGNAMLALSFFLSTLVKTRASANSVGVAILLVGFIVQLIIGNQFIINALFDRSAEVGWQIARWCLVILYPPTSFSKMYWDLQAGAISIFERGRIIEPYGYYWGNLTYNPVPVNSTVAAQPDCGSAAIPAPCAEGVAGTMFYTDEPALPSGLETWWWMLFNTILFLLLGLYLDQVLFYGLGPFFLFKPSFWKNCGPKGSAVEKSHEDLSQPKGIVPRDDSKAPEDIQREFARADKAFADRGDGEDQPLGLNVVRLTKQFSNLLGQNPFTAVNQLSLTADGHEILCILGHNGAGKTTTINVLNGVFPPTGGTAQMHNMDVRYDMDELRAVTGLCPQHDILWPELTASEHVSLFCDLKGIDKDMKQAVIQAQLSAVDLWGVADDKSGTFSGGMKRRLSVAIASVGNPLVLFLDEPTTGLDPASKRHVWDLIRRLRASALVLLTTHSLEEADALSDRIAIMAAGQLCAIGTGLHLKNQHGSGYNLHITMEGEFVSEENIADLTDVFTKQIKGLELAHSNAGNLSYRVPQDELKAFTALVQALENPDTCPKEVRDWGVSQTTLEDVFLTLTEENATGVQGNWFESN